MFIHSVTHSAGRSISYLAAQLFSPPAAPSALCPAVCLINARLPVHSAVSLPGRLFIQQPSIYLAVLLPLHLLSYLAIHPAASCSAAASSSCLAIQLSSRAAAPFSYLPL